MSHKTFPITLLDLYSHCNELIIRITLFTIDQSKIMVKYMASNCAYNNDMCVVKAIIS